MILSGNLTDWSVADLLQMLHVTKKTASLHITGDDRSGTVYFEEGKIVNAVVSLGSSSTKDGQDGVIEAVYVLELLDEGTFEMQNEVPSHKVDAMVVSDALDLTALHVTAERDLEDSGLLAARGLRLAQTVDTPITLSEQVWNAVSVSIPVFTFPELERRLGRAAAVSTIEQFRDLGILEAVIDGDVPVDEPSEIVIEQPSFSSDTVFDHDAESPGESAEAEDVGFGEIVPIGLNVTDAFIEEAVEALASEPSVMPLGPIVPDQAEDHLPIVVDAPSSDISSADISVADISRSEISFSDDAVADSVEATTSDEDTDQQIEGDAGVEEEASEESVEQPVAMTSLAAAIRAAALAGGSTPVVSPEPVDDESMLLAEAAGEDAPLPGPEETFDGADHSTLRRAVRSLVAPPETTLVSGVIGDMSARFRRPEADSKD